MRKVNSCKQEIFYPCDFDLLDKLHNHTKVPQISSKSDDLRMCRKTYIHAERRRKDERTDTDMQTDVWITICITVEYIKNIALRRGFATDNTNDYRLYLQ